MNRSLTTASAAVALLAASLTACSSSTPATSDKPKAAHTTASSPAKHGKTSATNETHTARPLAKKPPTAQARKQAAAILKKEDQTFRDFLAQGVKVTGTPQFTAWYQKAIAGLDMKQTAFSKADALFTADNEPTDLLEQWRSDNGDANAAITQYAMDGTAPDAPNAKTRKDAADCVAALAKADKDAEKIATGG